MTTKLLILIRGLPGSGKSRLATELAYSLGQESWVATLEADNFFYNGKEYNFNPNKLPEAHEWCYNGCASAFCRQVPYVIVSNTATRKWEYEKYIKLAREYDYKVQVIDVHGEWDNIHGVPEEHLKKMEDRWEPFDRKLLCR